jgi:hypothetical protein
LRLRRISLDRLCVAWKKINRAAAPLLRQARIVDDRGKEESPLE